MQVSEFLTLRISMSSETKIEIKPVLKHSQSRHNIQVAKLSLTHPRDVLHHDKRQKFKTIT